MHMSKASLPVLLCVALLAFAPTASADVDQEARAIFDAGAIAYEAGRYENALANFEHAYELSHRPELLYNIGLTAEHLRRDDRAVAAYEQYLAELPNGANRAAVESRLAVLRQAVAEREETERRLREAQAAAVATTTSAATAAASGGDATNAAPTADAASDSTDGRSTVRLVLLSSGAALLTGAAATGVWWAMSGHELDRCQSADPATSVCLNESSLESRRNAALGTTLATGVVGAALFVTGLVLPKRDDRRVACVPVGAGIGCAGRF